jgi:hypothetical protein
MLESLAAMSVDDLNALVTSPPAAEGPVCETDEELNYLLAHKFEVNLVYPYPRLEGLFPQMTQHKEAPPKRLTAVFILCPAYKMTDDHMRSSYFGRAEISERDMWKIQKVSPDHITQLDPTDKEVAEGKVLCSYHSWVS